MWNMWKGRGPETCVCCRHASLNMTLMRSDLTRHNQATCNTKLSDPCPTTFRLCDSGSDSRQNPVFSPAIWATSSCGQRDLSLNAQIRIYDFVTILRKVTSCVRLSFRYPDTCGSAQYHTDTWFWPHYKDWCERANRESDLSSKLSIEACSLISVSVSDPLSSCSWIMLQSSWSEVLVPLSFLLRDSNPA